jgi:hypothetical protein
MHAYAKDNFKFIAIPLFTSGLAEESAFEEAFLKLLQDYDGVTEDEYRTTPEVLDGCPPGSILRFLIPERVVSHSLSDPRRWEHEELVSLYSEFTQQQWLPKSVRLELHEVIIEEENGQEKRIGFHETFEDELQEHIESMVDDAAFYYNAVSDDYFEAIWLPTVVIEAIEKRIKSLNDRASERLWRFKPGDRIEVRDLGAGTVISFDPGLSGDSLEAKLDSGEIQRFSMDASHLRPLCPHCDHALKAYSR